MMAVAEGYVALTFAVRLWVAVPQEERLTEAEVVQRWPSYPQGSVPPCRGGPILLGHYADWVSENMIDLLRRADRDETCECAVRMTGSKKWKPCAGPTYGSRRCVRHGGPSKHKPLEVRKRSAAFNWRLDWRSHRRPTSVWDMPFTDVLRLARWWRQDGAEAFAEFGQ